MTIRCRRVLVFTFDRRKLNAQPQSAESLVLSVRLAHMDVRLEHRQEKRRRAMQTNKPEIADKASAQKAAGCSLHEHETIRLTRIEQIAFVDALLNPPAPK